MKIRKIKVIIYFLFCISVLPFILIPVGASDSIPMNTIAPVWSDRIGEYEVLVDCSDNGQSIVAGSDTGILRWYDQTGKILWSYRENNKSIMSVSISGNGEYTAAAFFDPRATADNPGGEIVFFNRYGNRIWNFSTGATIHRVAISSGGDIVLTSANADIYIFNSTGNVLGRFPQKGVVWNVALTGDGNTGAAAVDNGWEERNGEIAIIDINKSTSTDYPTKNRAVSVGISNDGKTLLGMDTDNLYSFDRNGTTFWNFTKGSSYSSIALSPDGEYIAATSQFFVRFFNRSGTLFWTYQDTAYVNDVGVSENGDYIIAGLSNNKTVLFNKSGDILWTFNRSAAHVSLSDNGDYYVLGTSDKVYFFNRWGNASVEPEVTSTVSSGGIEHNLTLGNTSPGTTQSSPVSSVVPVVALMICSGILWKYIGKRDE